MKKRHWMTYAASGILAFGLAASLGCEKEEENEGVLQDAGKQADNALDDAGDKMEEVGDKLGGD